MCLTLKAIRRKSLETRAILSLSLSIPPSVHTSIAPSFPFRVLRCLTGCGMLFWSLLSLHYTDTHKHKHRYTHTHTHVAKPSGDHHIISTSFHESPTSCNHHPLLSFSHSLSVLPFLSLILSLFYPFFLFSYSFVLHLLFSYTCVLKSI